MKYLPGDLVIDYSRKILFVWKPQTDSTKLDIHQMRLATPGENRLFRDNFPGKYQVTFEAFKVVMPVFDRRRKHGIIYDHILVDESCYDFFRKFQMPFPGGYEEKLSFLIIKYLEATKHNIESTKDKSASKRFEKFKSLFAELLDVIKE